MVPRVTLTSSRLEFLTNLAFTLLAVTVINGMHKTTHIHEHSKSKANPDGRVTYKPLLLF
jgi:hypothetical protein